MSFLIISAGLFFISVFWIPFVSEFSGFVLAKLVFMLNFLIGQVKYFPFSEISDLYFPLLKVVLVYSVNFTLFYWLILRKARFILPFLIAFFLVISFGTYQHFKNENQESLVIFDINNFTAIDFINGNEHVLLTDSAFATDQRMRDFYLKNYLVSSNLSSNADVLSNSIDRDDIGLQYDENIAIFKGFRLLILDKSSHYLSGIFEKPRVDAVLVTGRKKVELEKLLQCFEFDKIIVDATVPIWKKKLLEAECDKLEVSYFDSSKDGAFITQF